MLKRILAAAAVSGLGVAMAVVGPGAHAATLQCTSTESCGGADLALATHGPLSLAVLNPDSTINGGYGYNNEKVGFTTSGANGSQDFTVFQDASEVTTTPAVPGSPASQSGVGLGGTYGSGDYVVMYTPGGKAVPSTDISYCVSVEDTYPTVAGKTVQRWALVLRNCKAVVGRGVPAFHPGSTNTAVAPAADNELAATVSNPNPYQLWAPTEVPGPYLEFQDVALNSQHYRHGYGGGNFVMDDRAFGGSGTWGLAYPENDGLNQDFTIIGCTEPVTEFNTSYYNCPAGPSPAP